MIIKKVNKGVIYYNNDESIHIKDYYNYCVNLLINWLTDNDKEINIIFGDYKVDFNNNFETIKIDIQIEHTLVKSGGRSVNDKIYGTTKTDNGEVYLVRIDKFNYYNSLDYIFEYSYPNTHNIKSSGYFNEFSDKIINITPSMYSPNFDKTNKIDSITLFSSNSSQRRDDITKELKEKNINCINIDNCFSSDDLINQYNKTKIMLNVHQTEHHHTFEELRVLPALSNGVIIISENVPLKELIPYSNHVVWCEYSELSNTLKYVQENYEEFYEKLFNNELKELLLTLKETNNKKLNILNK